MSLSDYSSASFSLGGYATKPSIISLSGQDAPAQQGAVESLRDYFARRSDVSGKDALLFRIDSYLNEGGHRNGVEVVADLTRKQRKAVRLLGFRVGHANGGDLSL